MDRISEYDLVQQSKEQFKLTFGYQGTICSVAPGRINIIGEHTDYNFGLAMPIGINRWICSVISKRDDNKVNIYSSNYKKQINTCLSDLKYEESWEKYIIGCIYVVKEKFNLNEGFDLLVSGNVPIGFGMSSSAALEVSILSALLSIYNFKLDFSLILELSNVVENSYLNINSGLLDQYASIYSKKHSPLIVDFSNLKHSYVNMNINDACWILINSMVNRELVSSKYNKRVNECKKGLNKINTHLNTNKNMNELECSDLKYLSNEKVLHNRLSHVISENKRVLLMREYLDKGDLNEIGSILNMSHDSLSHLYNVSCNEIENIILLSKKQQGFYGGRIMGGGFGGCTLNLIDSSKKDSFINGILSSFYSKYKYELKIELVSFSDGVQLY